DLEQNPADSETVLDYPHLTAMRAPRPTLLVYNAEDDCCFRAPLVKPGIYDAVRPFFRLYGKESNLAWHENADPGTHNYQLDNRMASYHFLYRHLGLPDVEAEELVGGELRSFEELEVGLPANNLSLLALARKLADTNRRPGGTREDLAEVVRFRQAKLRHPWAWKNTTNKGVDARPYLFDFEGGLPAAGVRVKAIGSRPVRATIILNDQGKAEAAAEISERVNREEDVLAVDLLFTGDAAPSDNGLMRMPQLFDAIGERALGIEAGQLVELARWVQATSGVKTMRLEVAGIRSQTVAMVAAALKPGLFSEVVVRQGMGSLRHLLEAPVSYLKAPDLFCHGLYQRFDLDDMVRLSAPTVVQRVAAARH
ncbi:MAG: hypothetical protein NTY38_10355, partial [Acidobacteria bacterium]|nr:hypothetical protein [Acidobacteriota bacterium]